MISRCVGKVEFRPEPIDHPTPGTHIWGWMTIPELDWLHAQAKLMDSVVEVGSLRGRSAFALATGCEGPVWCIDPWDDPAGEGYRAFMADVGHRPNVHAIKGFSPAASALVPDVDMVFLDGEHDRKSLEADIDAWLPKCRKLICGHDLDHVGYPDVREVITERFGERVLFPADTLWAVEI